MVPVGASKCVGASRSNRVRRSHGKRAISASERSPAENSFSEVLSNSAGTSQSSLVAASAASDRSGQGSPSAARRNITRPRHCVSALDHGSRSRPMPSSPSARIRAVSAVGVTGSRASDNVMACRRLRRRARRAIAALSNVTSSALSICAAKRASISSCVIGAASRIRPRAAVPVSSAMAMYGARASEDVRASIAPRPLASTKLPLPRFFATRSGNANASMAPVDSAAGSSGAGAKPDACDAHRFARSLALLARCERSRRNCSSRVSRSALSPPSPRSVRIAATAAASSPEPNR